MRVKDIMSKLIVCNKNDIYEASLLMKKYDIGFLPIINNNKILGVITDRDIVTKCIVNHENKFNLNNNVETIDEEDSLENALNLMKKNKIKRLLVTNDNKVIGVISLSDIVKYVNSDTFIETFKNIYEIDKNEHDYKVEIDEFYL